MLPSDTHIGGWFLPSKIIDDISDFWKAPSSQKFKKKGTINPKKSGHSTTNKKIKESIEMYVQPSSGLEPFKEYEIYLQKCLEDYLKHYPAANWVEPFSIRKNYNVQWYPKNGGFKELHTENSGCDVTVHRHLVFMTYLNDVVDGGTHFPQQNIITPSIKGLTLIWPAHFTHPHKSQISKTKEKMIVTGWWNFDAQYDAHTGKQL